MTHLFVFLVGASVGAIVGLRTLALFMVGDRGEPDQYEENQINKGENNV